MLIFETFLFKSHAILASLLSPWLRKKTNKFWAGRWNIFLYCILVADERKPGVLQDHLSKIMHWNWLIYITMLVLRCHSFGKCLLSSHAYFKVSEFWEVLIFEPCLFSRQRFLSRIYGIFRSRFYTQIFSIRRLFVELNAKTLENNAFKSNWFQSFLILLNGFSFHEI